jgi:hypothetical protein
MEPQQPESTAACIDAMTSAAVRTAAQMAIDAASHGRSRSRSRSRGRNWRGHAWGRGAQPGREKSDVAREPQQEDEGAWGGREKSAQPVVREPQAWGGREKSAQPVAREHRQERAWGCHKWQEKSVQASGLGKRL